jgi:hypothetical protein
VLEIHAVECGEVLDELPGKEGATACRQMTKGQHSGDVWKDISATVWEIFSVGKRICSA